MKNFQLICFAFLFNISLFAQQNVELGGLVGVTLYQGDIAEDQIEISETQLGFGAYLSYLLNPKIILRGNAYYGKVSGDDKNSVSLSSRGYSFEGNVLEIGFNTQWLIFGRNRMNNSGIFVPQFTPYLSTGLAIASIDVDLKYPDTEENNANFPEKEDTDTFLAIPFSVGLRYELAEFITLGAESGIRATFSDYIDDVSLNGNPNKNDYYWFGGVTLGYVFGKAENFKF